MQQSSHVSAQLPFNIRIALVNASRVPVTDANPLARIMAIEAVEARAKRDYPHLFRGGDHGNHYA